MSECTKRHRDQMTDEEFWQDVAESLQGSAIEPDPEDDPGEPEFRSCEPCSECGEFGPCGYDSEGRPYIHVSRETDE